MFHFKSFWGHKITEPIPLCNCLQETYNYRMYSEEITENKNGACFSIINKNNHGKKDTMGW